MTTFSLHLSKANLYYPAKYIILNINIPISTNFEVIKIYTLFSPILIMIYKLRFQSIYTIIISYIDYIIIQYNIVDIVFLFFIKIIIKIF